jgi:DNA-binding CsgD family transcriptional regulator
MSKKSIIPSSIQQSWRWSLLMGVVASIFSLMLGLLLQTVFYEFVSSIPSLIRQDSHISLPLCKSFPDLYGCEAWVGKWTSLEIWELSLQMGQISGLLLNLILVVIFSMWVTVRGRSDSLLLGLLTGTTGGFSTLILSLLFNVPLTLHSLTGIFGILMILLLPLGGALGGRFGKEQLSRIMSRRSVYFLPKVETVQLDGVGENLSKRELEVLALVATGFKNSEISQQLYISKATVKTHLQHIFNKLGVENRTAAVTKALAYGWIIQEDEIASD